MNILNDGIKKTLKNITKGITKEIPVNCPNCGKELKTYSGKYGKFRGCMNYQNSDGCKVTYNL